MNQNSFRLWVIVPVKPFDEGKSRLAEVLSPHKRETLSKRLFAHVMGVIQEAAICEEVLVISRSDEVLSTATEFGALGLQEKSVTYPPDLYPSEAFGTPAQSSSFRATESRATESQKSGTRIIDAGLSPSGQPTGLDPLNQALEQSRLYAQQYADAILVIPADLPLITPIDLIHLKEVASVEPSVVIAPSIDGGTNALLLHPTSVIDFAFGEGSFRRHCRQAHKAGIACHIFESTNLATDVDHPEDLAPINEWL